MKSEAAFYALARRRAANPVREARRQAHLTRMANRIDFVPQYRDTISRGERVASRYIGHRAVSVR